jgi:hypothetical protein
MLYYQLGDFDKGGEYLEQELMSKAVEIPSS